MSHRLLALVTSCVACNFLPVRAAEPRVGGACERESDCGDLLACSGGVCANVSAPLITSISGDTAAGARIQTSLIVAGSNLARVTTVRIGQVSGDVFVPIGTLPIARAEADSLIVGIPAEVAAALASAANPLFTLEAASPGGAARQSVSILRGEPGPQGAEGTPGATGATGLQGTAGSDGNDGASGPTGARGPTGPSGDPGLSPTERTAVLNAANLLGSACTAGDYVSGVNGSGGLVCGTVVSGVSAGNGISVTGGATRTVALAASVSTTSTSTPTFTITNNAAGSTALEVRSNSSILDRANVNLTDTGPGYSRLAFRNSTSTADGPFWYIGGLSSATDTSSQLRVSYEPSAAGNAPFDVLEMGGAAAQASSYVKVLGQLRAGDIKVHVVTLQNTGGGNALTVSCPAGETALGGGCDCDVGDATTSAVAALKTVPTGSGWHCVCADATTNAHQAYAVCAQP